MPSIPQRIVQTIARYNNKKENTPVNEHRAELSPTIFPYRAQEIGLNQHYEADVQAFCDRMMNHIQRGTLTQEALDNALEKRRIHATENVGAEVDREIEEDYKSLPESQHQRFMDNIDRDARIDAKLNTPMNRLFEEVTTFGNQVYLIANLVDDQEIKRLATSICTNPYPVWRMRPNLQATFSADGLLGEQFTALRLQQAAKIGPAAFQQFVQEALERFNQPELWDEPKTWDDKARDAVFAQIPTILAQPKYANSETSGIVCNALVQAKMPLETLENVKEYLTLLSSEDMARIKTRYAQEFSKKYVKNTISSVDLSELENIESFLKDPTFSGFREPTSSLMRGRSEDNSKTAVGRLADVMAQAYDIDTVVSVLEVYQGNRALAGNLSADEMLPDVRGYLAIKTTRSIPEDIKLTALAGP